MHIYDLIVTDWVTDFLYALEVDKAAKVRSVLRLFEEYGHALPVKYLKRMSGTKELWELRAKNIRIFLIFSGNTAVAVHGIIKKTQKIPHQDIETAIKRAMKAKEDLL